MKISLVGACSLADGYLGAAKALERCGHTVAFIPAMAYQMSKGSNHYAHIIGDLEVQKPDIVLFWRAETLDASQLQKIKRAIRKPFAFYSWDDPYQWEKRESLRDKCPYINFAFSCCADSVKTYTRYGSQKAFFLPPGFDPSVHYPEHDENFSCDISIVCTNFYDDPNVTPYPHINRRKFIEEIIAKAPDIKTHIYGPENFAAIFSLHYKGWMSFDQSRKVFSNSKINICTHIRPDGNMYINERVTQILGSGGLLYVDKTRNMDKLLTDKECVLIDKNNFVQQVQDILNNYEQYQEIKSKGYEKAMKTFTWDVWADKFLRGISLK